MRFGSPRRHYALTDSTNERARDLVEAGAPGGTVVTAAEQSAGRGRHGRRWTAPAGKALLCSFVLRPLTAANEVLPLAVPLAVCEAAEEVAPVECAVKWPNDVWIDGRKVGGVLIEARPSLEGGWAVIGIGLNVAIASEEFPAELREIATSLEEGTVDGALRALSDKLALWVAAEPPSVVEEFGRRDALAGKRVSWTGAGGESGDGAGVARGVDERGELVVELDSGEARTLSAGEVHLGRTR